MTPMLATHGGERTIDLDKVVPPTKAEDEPLTKEELDTAVESFISARFPNARSLLWPRSKDDNLLEEAEGWQETGSGRGSTGRRSERQFHSVCLVHRGFSVRET